MATLAASAEIRYAALETLPTSQADGASPTAGQATGAYGRLYLQKMVQIQFDLPPPSLAGLHTMLTAPADAGDTPAALTRRVVLSRPSLATGTGMIARVVGKWPLLGWMLLAGVVTSVVGVIAGARAAVIAAPVIVVVLTIAVVLRAVLTV
jgi:hypothetical protein